jgi:hypothetical protein
MEKSDIYLDRTGRAYEGCFYLGYLYTREIVFVGERIIKVADGTVLVVTGGGGFDSNTNTYRSTIDEYNGTDEELQEILHNYRKEHECKVPAHDAVEHPAHYETGKFECIDVMLETQGKQAVTDFCVCNAFKYLYRHGRKNGVEDLKKARWYLDKAIGLIEGE